MKKIIVITAAILLLLFPLPADGASMYPLQISETASGIFLEYLEVY